MLGTGRLLPGTAVSETFHRLDAAEQPQDALCVLAGGAAASSVPESRIRSRVASRSTTDARRRLPRWSGERTCGGRHRAAPAVSGVRGGGRRWCSAASPPARCCGDRHRFGFEGSLGLQRRGASHHVIRCRQLTGAAELIEPTEVSSRRSGHTDLRGGGRPRHSRCRGLWRSAHRPMSVRS